MAQPDDNSVDLTVEEKALRAEIERSGQELEKLQGQLGDIDHEIRELSAKGPQFEALSRLCMSLQELEAAGAGNLFWGDGRDPAEAADRLDAARARVVKFQSDLACLHDKRKSLAAQIGKQNLVIEGLDYDLAEALELREERDAEWLIERQESKIRFRRMVMPWARGFEEDARFHRSLGATALVALLLGAAIPFIDLPIVERERLIEVPERVAKLVELNRPPPVEAAEPVLPEPEPEPAEPEPEELEPEQLVAEEVVQELSEEPAEQVAEAQPQDTREQVRSRGILAFRDSFANRANAGTTARLGSQARVRSEGQNAVGLPTRSMVTSNAPGSSGGINLASISRDVGGGSAGGSIGGVEVTRVATTIGGNGSGDRPLAGGPSAGRTDEEIQIVFDRYKAALYRLYNRELRRDPSLRGQIVLKLTIEPDGTVSFCELQSTDMNAPDLTQQIVSRVSGFDFGAKEDILAVTIVYPIDFLPAA